METYTPARLSAPLSSLNEVVRFLTDEELRGLLITVQNELLNRPRGATTLAVDVVTDEEAHLLGDLRALPHLRQEVICRRVHHMVDPA